MNKDEFNRLDRAKQKADKKKSQQPLYDWAIQLEQQLSDKTKKFYDEKYNKNMRISIEWYLIAMMYVLHFNEKTKFGAKRLQYVMNDIQATAVLFGKEYSADDYIQQLKDDGIELSEFVKEKANERVERLD